MIPVFQGLVITSIMCFMYCKVFWLSQVLAYFTENRRAQTFILSADSGDIPGYTNLSFAHGGCCKTFRVMRILLTGITCLQLTLEACSTLYPNIGLGSSTLS